MFLYEPFGTSSSVKIYFFSSMVSMFCCIPILESISSFYPNLLIRWFRLLFLKFMSIIGFFLVLLGLHIHVPVPWPLWLFSYHLVVGMPLLYFWSLRSCREVARKIVIEVEDIVLGSRVVVWIVFCIFVLINGFVFTFSEYETPVRFITTCQAMDEIINLFRHRKGGQFSSIDDTPCK